MATYLVIEPREKWSLDDLKVFYRIVSGYHLAIISEENGIANAIEDFEQPGITEYCFNVTDYPNNAFDAERVMLILIGRFNWMVTDKKPPRFRRNKRKKKTEPSHENHSV